MKTTIDGVDFWTEPNVILVGKLVPVEAGIRELAEAKGISPDDPILHQPETPAEIAGRVCYNSFSPDRRRPGGSQAYFNRILSEGHGSVVGHCVLQFFIQGISRTLTHELIRHSVGTVISQASQRYVDQGEYGFVVGSTGNFNNSKWLIGLLSEYKYVVAKKQFSGMSRKEARSIARGFLPQCCATEIVWQVNGRALRHIIEQRASSHADWEIRRLANVLYAHAVRELPALFSDYSYKVLSDGTAEITTDWRKV